MSAAVAVEAEKSVRWRPGAGPVNVFLLLGQSNAEGLDFAREGRTGAGGHRPLESWAEDAGTGLFAGLGGRPRRESWTGLGACDGVYGPEIGLGRGLHAAGWRNVAIIKFTRGDSSIRQFLPGDPFGYGRAAAGTSGPDLYSAWCAHLEAALAELGEAAAGRIVPRGIAWVQGEHDSSWDEETRLYACHLRTVATALRAGFGEKGASMRFVAARTAATQPAKADTLARLREAQASALDGTHAEHPITGGGWFSVDDVAEARAGAVLDWVALPTGGREDAQHFTPEGHEVIGRRFARAFGAPPAGGGTGGGTF